MARIKVEVPVEQKTEAQVQHLASSPNHSSSPNHKRSPYRTLAFVALFLGILFVINLIQDRNRLQQELDRNSNQNDTSSIISSLSQAIELPIDEEPESRTIENASKFTEQNPSLSDIKDGDVLLFFPKNQKVVVYRPATKKAVVVVKLAQPNSSSGQNIPEND